ncbi:hypothetical protein ACFPVX_16880 [Cohnella faecalis]|uniref:Uncharacterized protein n=1 Tax=Cohnella faecalis TaxID=2315694 RepID=A0A398CPZ6_9BACL|nr:hypothetical protein [Cohnella faecalis]RIE02818.1 hypothetical protein D3H35_19490 [Cohnella faecalis]
MSLPNVPNITPTINVTTKDAVNLLLVSIALEEISLAHIMNAEAEKIQFILGTLPGTTHPGSIGEVLHINKDVRATLNEVVLKEVLLQMKLNSVLDAFPQHLT